MTNKELAESLASELRELADACLKAAEGDADARRVLRNNIDSYWHALVVGTHKVEQLLEDEEQPEDTVQTNNDWEEPEVEPDGGGFGRPNPGIID